MSATKTAIEKLTPEQLRMLELVLADEKSNKEIADELGIHINTFYQRKNKKIFQEALKDQYKEGIRSAQAVFAGKAAYAAKRIAEMIDDPEATRVQFQAACKVYDSAVGITIDDFEDRLIAIEESVTREV